MVIAMCRLGASVWGGGVWTGFGEIGMGMEVMWKAVLVTEEWSVDRRRRMYSGTPL